MKFFKQADIMDCGPTCIKMLAYYYGKNIDINALRQYTQLGKEGVNLLGISEAAEQIGFNTQGVKVNIGTLLNDVPKPAILHWGQNLFVVLAPKSKTNSIIIADPANGIVKYNKKEFADFWASDVVDGEPVGIALILEPSTLFFEQEDNTQKKELGWHIIVRYLLKQRKFIIQLILALLFGSVLQLLVPFLTQSIVDVGVKTNDIGFINLILIGQFVLFFSRTIIDFIRSRILLYISTYINLQILSDFWIKLMRLPMHYFDTKLSGDILQRLSDQKRIESFLTGTALSTLLSLFNLVIFSIVLLQYNTAIFFIFLIASVLYLVWISVFLKFRRQLDYKRFDISGKENTITMQLIFGMQEIKLQGAENLKRWEWENLQTKLFKLTFKSLSLSQWQQTGSFLINEGKNIIITFLVAKLVISGQLSLGAMLAVQYILGQLNSPIEQLIGFIQSAQDAKMSLERLNEIHTIPDEEEHKAYIKVLPQQKTINISNLNFTYNGAGNEPVLKNISLTVPQGKVTAIVGMSGSGKTTLLKLLLKFYDSYTGDINIGDTSFKNISPKFWRKQCGSVMQDGFIFNDTIANNIAVGDEHPNHSNLINACKIANILTFIETMPLGFNTKIGAEGTGISQGQKQRILIARAIYKNPEYLFFDEATNALDANNEKEILTALNKVFEGKTVIVVAHRLSTVKNADNIIVLQQGTIVEQGTHDALVRNKSFYYELVSNQLALGE
jgi:ATP-binding cassette, subfamily B, bacterial